MAWHDLIPDPLERERWRTRFVLGGVVLLVALLAACWPGLHRARRLRAAERALDGAVQAIQAYERQHGQPPGHIPLKRVARLTHNIAAAGGDTLTTFDPAHVAPAPRDPLSAGGGTQPLYYFEVRTTSGTRWLVGSVGLDGRYQVQGRSLAAFATLGPAALAGLRYDPTNGTRSAGDVVRFNE